MEKRCRISGVFVSAQPEGSLNNYLFSVKDVRAMNRLADEIEAKQEKQPKICISCGRKYYPDEAQYHMGILSCELSPREKQSIAVAEKLGSYNKQESPEIKIGFIDENPETEEGGGWYYVGLFDYAPDTDAEHEIEYKYARTLPAAILALEGK